jgi:sugar diacid utilization regulator
MAWERLRSKLEHILETPVILDVRDERDWQKSVRNGGDKARHAGFSAIVDGQVCFVLESVGGQVRLLCLDERHVSESERRLIELMAETAAKQQRKSRAAHYSEDEARASAIRDWIAHQLEQGSLDRELPEEFSSESSLYLPRVPFLLQADYTDKRKLTYVELKKLVESYYMENVDLIPLREREWLILSPERVLQSSATDDKEDGGETIEESLEAICSGLHEMIATESIGECHLAVDYPIVPAKSLLRTIVRLREAVMLGRTFHFGQSVHLHWKLHLESLLFSVPESERGEFLERLLQRTDAFADAEMQLTLEQFFQLDCNVSETAKKLYIHRNTLLYRLDKFKQETGFDVRHFNDAVLVKIALLLYKVTKR